MLKIGITGGIGSGKTVVCKLFELLCIPVYYADTEAKRLMHEDKILISQIKKKFGTNIYDQKNQLNKKLLSEIVFKDEIKLKILNSLVHPAVKKDFLRWVKKQKNTPYVIKEAALLFESSSYKQLDKIITVYAPVNLRITRTIKRDHISKNEVKKRMNAQMNDEAKIKRSDFVIYNDEKTPVIFRVLQLHKRLLSLN